MTRHVFEIDDDGDRHCYSARDDSNALDQHALLTHESVADFRCDHPEVIVTQLDDDYVLPVTCVDDLPEDVPEATGVDEMGRPVVAKTCADWAAAGEGCISSSVW